MLVTHRPPRELRLESVLLKSNDFLAEVTDLADLVRAFSQHRVSYLVVGGYAVGIHARPRATKDLDLWLESSAENRERVAQALAAFGAPNTVAESLRKAKDDEIVWFGRPPNRVDLLLHLPGVEFEQAIKRAIYVRSGHERIPVIGAKDLMRNKRAVGRDQDLVDEKNIRRALKLCQKD